MSDVKSHSAAWPECSFGDLAEFRNGLNFTRRSNGHALKVIGVGDFANLEMMDDYSGLSTVTMDGDLDDDDLLENDDLLFVRSNGNKALIGRCVLIENVSEPISFSGFTIRARIATDKVDAAYLSKVVRSHLFKHHLHRLGGGSSINNLSQKILAKFTFPLPPLTEQRKTAEILRTWDEAIDKLGAIWVAKRKNLNALASRFFDPCHPSVHGRPNSWREFELGDVFQERVESGSNDEALLSITMSGGVINRDDVGRKDTSNEDKSRYKLILPGDIGYNTMRMWQGVSGLSTLRGVVSPAYTIVTPDNRNISARYAAHLFKSRRMVFDFERYSQGLTSDTWNLKFPAFSKIRVFLPPIEHQERQADLLDAMYAEIALLERQRNALDCQKCGLMQKLLAGEWRVKVEG